MDSIYTPIKKNIVMTKDINIINTKSEFFGKLFQIRDKIHLIHLKVNGSGAYAAHKALDEYYNKILDLTDELIEGTQGEEGLLNITIPSSASSEDGLNVLKDFRTYVTHNRKQFEESWQQNVLDEIQQLNSQTIYKLTNLK